MGSNHDRILIKNAVKHNKIFVMILSEYYYNILGTHDCDDISNLRYSRYCISRVLNVRFRYGNMGCTRKD